MYLIECIAGPEDGRMQRFEILPFPAATVSVNGHNYRYWARRQVLMYIDESSEDAMTRKEAPAIGIHENISFEEYCSWDAVNQSHLKTALSSLLKYRDSAPIETTDAMRLGSLIHTCKLEPKLLTDRYAVMPAFEHGVRTDKGETPSNPKATKQYKELKTNWLERNRDKEIVEQAWMNRAHATILSLSENDRCREYLTDGKPEVSIVWLDSDTGLLCKARIDYLQPHRRITDLKTTDSLAKFPQSMWSYRYDLQGAFYSDGIYAVTGKQHEFCIAAVEPKAPFECGAAPLSQRAIRQGRHDYKRALRAVKQAEESGIWPGFESPESWDVPEYARKTIIKVHGESVSL